MTTVTPMTTVPAVDKLNKGTSRDQWGNFGFWGFKTPNGKIRTRVVESGHFEVKLFDPSKLPSYRKTMNWDDAQLLGSAYLTVSDADKGPNSKEMVAETNAIIDGYNDTLAKWHSKHVMSTKIHTGNSTSAETEGFVVESVTVEFDENAVLTTTLLGSRGYYRDKLLASEAKEVSTNDYRGQLRELINTEKKNIETALAFIDTLNMSVEQGMKIPDSSYSGKGSISHNIVSKMVTLANALIPDKVETEVETPTSA